MWYVYMVQTNQLYSAGHSDKQKNFIKLFRYFMAISLMVLSIFAIVYIFFIFLIEPYFNTQMAPSFIPPPSISSDMTEVVFNACSENRKENKCAIYIMQLHGDGAHLLTSVPKGYSYENPTFSPDGQHVAFIARPSTQYNHDKFGDIYIINRDGQNMRQLTFPQQGIKNVREIVFSPDGQSIFFIHAGVYENYSPVVLPSPHDYDLYLISLNDSQIQRLTFESVYYLFDLAVVPDKRLLLVSGATCSAGPSGISSGVCLLPIDRLPLKPQEHVASFLKAEDLSNNPYVVRQEMWPVKILRPDISQDAWPTETMRPIGDYISILHGVSSIDKHYQIFTGAFGADGSTYNSDVYLFDNFKQNYINLTKKNFHSDSSFKLPYGFFLQKQEYVIVVNPETREIWSVKYDGSEMQSE